MKTTFAFQKIDQSQPGAFTVFIKAETLTEARETLKKYVENDYDQFIVRPNHDKLLEHREQLISVCSAAKSIIGKITVQDAQKIGLDPAYLTEIFGKLTQATNLQS